MARLGSSQLQTIFFGGVALLALLVAFFPSSAPQILPGTVRSCGAIKAGHRGIAIAYDCRVRLDAGDEVIAHAVSPRSQSARVEVIKMVIGHQDSYRLVEAP